MKIHEFAVLAGMLLANEAGAQVSNDTCGGATQVLVWTTEPCIMQLGGSGDHWAGDSTDNAVVNFPYPSNPNPCSGYASSMGPPGKDVWFHMGYAANAYVWEMTCSDTCHISWWVGNCGTLAPLECYTILPNVPTYTEAWLPVGIWSEEFYLQVVAKNPAVDISFDACWTYYGVFGGGGAVFVHSTPTPVTCFTDSLAIANPTSSAASDGSIEVVILDGNPPYTILWNDGDMNFNRTDLGIGEYSFQVTDGVGCSQSDTVMLDLSTGLAAEPVGTSLIHWECDPNSGAITLLHEGDLEGCELTLFDPLGQCVLHADISSAAFRIPAWTGQAVPCIAEFRFNDRPPLRHRMPVCLTN